jgi:antitoxin VapB
MTRAYLLLTETGQTVRLPENMAFPPTVREVVILRERQRRVIVPADAVWDDFFDAPGIDLGERAGDEQPERERL